MTDADAPIRVLLVEDSDVYRDSLVFLLGTRTGLEVVDAVPDGASARPRRIASTSRTSSSSTTACPTSTAAAVAAEIDSAVVFLSASAGRDEYDAASSAGAALVRKDEGIDALVRAVRAAAGR